MEPKFITAEQLADSLAVGIDTLRMWRTRRIKIQSPALYLPADGPQHGKQATYLMADVRAFLTRNETYRNRALAVLAPDAAREAFALPRAVAAPPTAPAAHIDEAAAWWASHADNSQHQEQQP